MSVRENKSKPTWTPADYEKLSGEKLPETKLGTKARKRISPKIAKGHPVPESEVRKYNKNAIFAMDYRTGEAKWPRNWLHIILEHIAESHGVRFSNAISMLRHAMNIKHHARGNELLKGQWSFDVDHLPGISDLTGFSGNQIAMMENDYKEGRDFLGDYDGLVEKYGKPGSAVDISNIPGVTGVKKAKFKPHRIVELESGDKVVVVPVFDLDLDIGSGRYNRNEWTPHRTVMVDKKFFDASLKANPRDVIMVDNLWSSIGSARTMQSDESEKFYVDTSRTDMDGSILVFRLKPDGDIFIRQASLSEDGECVDLIPEDPKAKRWLNHPVADVIPIGVVIYIMAPAVLIE